MAKRKDTFWTQSVNKLRPLELEWQEELRKLITAWKESLMEKLSKI